MKAEIRHITTRSQQIIADHNRSPRITADHNRSPRITTRSQQITTDHRGSQPDHNRSPQITTDHRGSQPDHNRSPQITLSASCAVVLLDRVADHTRFSLSPPLMCLVWFGFPVPGSPFIWKGLYNLST